MSDVTDTFFSMMKWLRENCPNHPGGPECKTCHYYNHDPAGCRIAALTEKDIYGPQN